MANMCKHFLLNNESKLKRIFSGYFKFQNVTFLNLSILNTLLFLGLIKYLVGAYQNGDIDEFYENMIYYFDD